MGEEEQGKPSRQREGHVHRPEAGGNWVGRAQWAAPRKPGDSGGRSQRGRGPGRTEPGRPREEILALSAHAVLQRIGEI